MLSAFQTHGSGTLCLSTFANPSHFLLLNAIWRLSWSLPRDAPPMRPDSLIDFGAIKVSYLLTYLLINFVTFQVKTCKPRLATPVQGAAIGNFNSLIPIPLLICPESFVVIAATVSHTVAMLTNIVTNKMDRKQIPCRLAAVHGIADNLLFQTRRAAYLALNFLYAEVPTG